VTAKGLRRSLDSIDNEWSASNDADPDAPSADAGSAAPPTEWEVNVEGREVVGMSAAEIVLKLRTGELSGQTLAWREGMDEWTTLDALPAFQLAAPASSRPAASESRPRVTEDVTVKRAPQRTEIGLQPPSASPPVAPPASPPVDGGVDDGYDPEDATKVRSLPDVPLDEATVIVRDAETLPPPPSEPPVLEPGEVVSARGDDLTGALAVYERPIATLAFPDLDAPTDEETIISDPPASSSEPPSRPAVPPAKAEEPPPVPPLPKLPSRALVSTAKAAFMPPAQSAPRSPSGAPRLSSLGPATGNRPSSPSSPSITKKPLVPSSPVPTSTPAPLVEALLSLTEKAEAPGAKPSAPPAPAAKVTSAPPAAPSSKAAPAKPPSSPPVRVKSELPAPSAEAPRSESPLPRVPRQHTPAETPIARASERPKPPETPTPAAAAVAPSVPSADTTVATATASPAAAVTPPPAPAIPLPADSDPVNEAPPPPPPLPSREPVNLASLPASTTPTIILREDRDADTLITNLRASRSVPLRSAVAGAVVSTVLGSLVTALVVSALQSEPPKAPPPAAVVTVTAAPVPPPAPAPEPPKPAVEETTAPAPSASEPAIPSVRARELATEKKPKRSATAWTPPKPKPVIADPEVALPDDPPAATDGAPADKSAEKKPSTPSESSDPAADKNKAAWETSPSPGF
jgi:hypothetical protein